MGAIKIRWQIAKVLRLFFFKSYSKNASSNIFSFLKFQVLEHKNDIYVTKFAYFEHPNLIL